MSAKILEANGKPAFAVLPIDECWALLGLVEDARDAAALTRAAKRYAKETRRFPQTWSTGCWPAKRQFAFGASIAD